MAIILALKHWRHLLMGAPKFEIWSDHKNLTYYRNPQDLTRRQAQWHQLLQEYNFTLHHKPGSLNQIANFLSHGDSPEKGVKDNESIVVLDPAQFCTLELRALTLRDDEAIMEEIRQRTTQRDDKVKQALQQKYKDYTEENGIILYKGLIYVPNDKGLQERIIYAFHNTIIAGHPGPYKTVEYITRNYWWPTIMGQVQRYCHGCEGCQSNKPHVGTTTAPLNPHTIPEEPWQNVSLDFIGPFPKSRGYDMILAVVDMLTKALVIIPCNQEISAMGTAELFMKHVTMEKGMFRKVVSDRGTQFNSKFTKELWKLLGVEQNMSTGYHPQTDGQTERANQEIEKYLRFFVDKRQTNWADWLPMAQFAINNRVNQSTGYTPFFLNHGRHPYDGFSPKKIQVSNQSAEDFAKGMAKALDDAKAALQRAQAISKEDYDRSQKPSRNYAKGDKVWLEGTNIATTRPSKKLDNKRYSPFKVKCKIRASAYELDLPCNWKTRLNNPFNERDLSPYVPPVSEIQMPTRPPPTLIDQQGEPHYEVERILDSRIFKKSLQYKVKWQNYPMSESTWQWADNLKDAPQKIKEFYKAYPDAIRDEPRRQTRQRAIEIPIT